MHQPEGPDKLGSKFILIMIIAPKATLCGCGHVYTISKKDLARMVVVTAADCPACGAPVIITPGEPDAGGETIH